MFGRMKVTAVQAWELTNTVETLPFFGKGNSKSRAAMGVTAYGNGAVSTWDKNGYRQ